MKMLLRTLGLAALLFAPAVVEAGPAIDPRQMSGIPRPDPAVPSGTVTVRVLRGGFDKPAIDTTVTLEIESASGETTTQTATTDGQGRAGFSGLAVGSRAIAKVDLDGEALESQRIDVLEQAGTRVMLVAGAAGSGAAGGARPPAHGQAGGPAVPIPGTAFPLQGTPKGDLVVGTFDLGAKKPIEGVEVTLAIETPDGKKTEQKGKTDRAGKFVFEKLGEPAFPTGTKFRIFGALDKGGEVQESKTFTMEGEVGLAVVLAKGELPAEMAPAADVPIGARFDPALPDGTVRVRVVDGRNQPVPEQPIVVVKKDMSGTDTPFPSVTDADGTVDVEVEITSEAFYFVEARYDRAPFQSGFFPVDKRGGVAVNLRVYPVTADPRALRSVVRFNVDGLENDLARVVQNYQVRVGGEKAFWPADGFRIEPAKGGKSLHVPEFAEEFLTHQDKSQPFATLANPIPPGEVVDLTIAYLVEHDGTAEIEWSPPFELMETSVLVGSDQTLSAAVTGVSEEKQPVPNKVAQLMGGRKVGEPVKFTMGGLPVRDPLYRRIAAIFGVLIGLAGAIAVLSRPRVDPRVRLRARRDELLGRLDRGVDGEARERIVTALDRVYRQLEVLESSAKGTAPGA